MKRKDIHRPSAVNPEEYEYVAYSAPGINATDYSLAGEITRQREIVDAHMAKTGGSWANHRHGGTCYICGASASYLVIFFHSPSKTYVKVGETCAENLDWSSDGLNLFRKAVRRQIEIDKGKKRAQRLLAEVGLSKAYEIYEAPGNFKNDDAWREKMTIRDVVRTVAKYGSLSTKQQNYLRLLLDRSGNKKEMEDQKKAAHDALPDIEEGRREIVAEVVFIRYYGEEETAWPGVKLLAKLSEGNSIFGSCPAAFCSRQPGEKIQFTATIVKSQKDPKFGFFKNPRVTFVR